ncbi:MAG: NAD(P)/FAD-dependent oxidoreductase [Candidatus Omnitrophica bacterium]|nr:NAD(P)/FAD-dependent oxidoreductase [Candidatus Omnitrophota bacterium]
MFQSPVILERNIKNSALKMVEFDVAIIGSGIGGLVCACYLLKAGLKTVIIERNPEVGGYCTSFYRDGYFFEGGPHLLGGIEKGVLGQLLTEIGVKNKINFVQFDPSDKLLLPYGRVLFIRKEVNGTLKEFEKCFPKEKKNIQLFFSYITQKNFLDLYSRFKKKTFYDLVNSFFTGEEIKQLLNILLFGVLGVSIEKIPAWIGIAVFKEFFLDPGYYPQGGMKEIPKTLAENIKREGGEILLKNEVKKIFTKTGSVRGLLLLDGRKIKVNTIVANIDPFQLSTLIKKRKEDWLGERIFTPSSSAVVLYLGGGYDLVKDLHDCRCIWNLGPKENFYKSQIIFSPSLQNSIEQNSLKHTLEVFSFHRWREDINEKGLFSRLLKMTKRVMPGIEKNIVFRDMAIPKTFYRYTLNRNGAILGNSLTIPQDKERFKVKSDFVEGLFLTGAWYSYGGISEAAITGKRTAMAILKELKLSHNFELTRL